MAARKNTNSAGDREWLAAQANAGLLEPIDDTLDLPFPARVMWNGEPGLMGSGFQIPDESHQCRGLAWVRDDEGNYVVDVKGNRVNRPCTNWRLPGVDICRQHVPGGTGKIVQTARNRLIESLDEAAGMLLEIAREARDPKVRLAALTQVFDRAGMKGAALDIKLDVPEWQEALKSWVARDGLSDDDG